MCGGGGAAESEGSIAGPEHIGGNLDEAPKPQTLADTPLGAAAEAPPGAPEGNPRLVFLNDPFGDKAEGYWVDKYEMERGVYFVR